MSNQVVISVENLSKVYGIIHEIDRQRSPLLREVISDRFRGLLRSRGWHTSASKKDFWALNNVSFKIRQGEVVGIIGRNGAGKSTLLKILSRITEPTQGRVRIKGRVASLLEVGTGFHPELSGRENIYLNGAILGMSRSEIKKKFDEIVAFAEVEQFLDVPVKRYSSGMYVRLAFAVAAHLEPEILILDEVLAVGDIEFQKKCLGKMQNVSREGRTVLFVSHNMQAVRQLCEQVLVLQDGEISFSGDIHNGITAYMGQNDGNETLLHNLEKLPRRTESQGARLISLEFLEEGGLPAAKFQRASNLIVAVRFRVERPLAKVDIPMALVHIDGQRVFSEVYSDQKGKTPLKPGEYSVRFTIPLRFLKLESYFLVIGIVDGEKPCDFVEGVPMPELLDPECDAYLEARRWGVVRIPVGWDAIKDHDSK